MFTGLFFLFYLEDFVDVLVGERILSPGGTRLVLKLLLLHPPTYSKFSVLFTYKRYQTTDLNWCKFTSFIALMILKCILASTCLLLISTHDHGEFLPSFLLVLLKHEILVLVELYGFLVQLVHVVHHHTQLCFQGS